MDDVAVATKGFKRPEHPLRPLESVERTEILTTYVADDGEEGESESKQYFLDKCDLGQIHRELLARPHPVRVSDSSPHWQLSAVPGSENLPQPEGPVSGSQGQARQHYLR